MSRKNYPVESKIEAVKIWIQYGGDRKAIKKALPEIKRKTGIILPPDGRSLWNWHKDYSSQLKPKEPEQSMFPEYEKTAFTLQTRTSDGKTKTELDYDKVNKIFFTLFGKDFEHVTRLSNKICRDKLNLDEMETAKRINRELRKMSIEKAERLISTLFKRVRDNLNFAIDLSKYQATGNDDENQFMAAISAAFAKVGDSDKRIHAEIIDSDDSDED